MAKKQSDEFAIDFSRISGLFKKKPGKHKKPEKAHEPEEEAPEEEFSLDIQGIWSAIYKYRVVILILIPILFSIFFRAQTFYLPQTDVWAEDSVQNYYRSQITSQVEQQYPNLPAKNKDAIVNDEVKNYINTHKSEYEQQVASVSENFKTHFQDETGQTYLLAIDPYQWYRYGKDIIDRGYMGDKKVDGQAYDMHMIAPLGIPVGKDIHPYLGAYLYKLIGSVTGMNLMGVFFILPIILMCLAVIPAFFIGKRIGGDIAGFFTAMVFALHPAVLTRTIAGFSDTDAYTVLFPLFIFWFIIEAFETKELKNKMIYSSLAGLFAGIFAFAWYGWWYIFDFAIGAIVLYLAYHIIIEYFVKKKRLLNDLVQLKDKKANDIGIIFLVFLFISSIFVVLFRGWAILKGAVLTQPLQIIYLKEAARITLWPNVYTTVAEMNAASISNIINSMGGKLLFIIGLAGIFLVLIKSMKQERRIAYFILVALWFFGALYASTKGIRFTLIMTPAYAIGFGVAVSFVYEYAGNWISREMNIKKAIVNIMLIIFLCMLLIPTINSAKVTAMNEVPSMNDAWNTALTKIKMNSSEDAIINSWWDFGHWFKAMADRPVTFDGASQNSPQAHWIGKVLLTSDEKQAVGILRMLDCGANNAFEVLNNETEDPIKSVNIVHDIITLEKDEAKNVLLNHVSEQTAEKVLRYTHCSPPEDFFITSEDMVGKAGVWAHFGSWNFEKAKIWKSYRKENMQKAVDDMMSEFNYSRDYAEKIYYEMQTLSDETAANTWISPWPGYITSAPCSRTSNTTIMCNFNVQNQVMPVKVNTTTENAFIETSKGRVYPYSLSYIDKNGQFTEKKYENKTLPYSMALSVKSDGIKGVLMSPELASSMFTRLFYFDGVGLEHFDLFDYQRDLTGLEIYTWKVDWDGKE